MKIKGKKVFTKTEIEQLLQLIKERRQAPSDKQKSIRNKMRKLGFYGRDDWGITDCTETDLIQLISNGKITVKDAIHQTSYFNGEKIAISTKMKKEQSAN